MRTISRKGQESSSGSSASSNGVPFFEANPLKTAKADDFKKFAKIVRMMDDRLHLTRVGLAEIAKIKATMNHRRPSRFLESSEAIRQPASVDAEVEEMVLAPWRHGDVQSEIPCRVDETAPRESDLSSNTG